jgi:hypothetical protein
MACVGDAVPAVDWSAFLADAESIPSQCADGSAGTVFSTVSPSVSLIDAKFRQQRSVRAVADWAGPILDNRFALGVQAVVTQGLNQPGQVDVNFDPTTHFMLANEANRPVFADPSAIVAATGAIAPGETRVSSAYQRVWVQRSDLRLDSRLLTINLKPVTANRFARWSLTYALLDVDQSFYGFSSTVGNPLDVARGPSLQPGKHSVTVGWSNFPIADLLYVTANLRFQSGARYTPSIAGDVNGDGVSNDRAFISESALAVASAGTSTMPGSARNCLTQQLGALAARGSCQSPWTTTGGFAVRFNPLKIGLPKRTSVSLSLENPLALMDLAMHGSNDIRGWGRAIPPDQTLLFVRGFDPVARQFKYDVNERFGSTRPRQTTTATLPYLTMTMSIDIGVPREKQALVQRLDLGRTRPGGKINDQALWLLGTTAIPNPISAIIAQAASLGLRSEQSDSLAWLNYRYNVFADSMWTPAARSLAALPADYNRDEAFAQFVRARERTIDHLILIAPQVLAILTPSQRRKLPLEISNYLDERVLRFLRSSSAGDASVLVR